MGNIRPIRGFSYFRKFDPQRGERLVRQAAKSVVKYQTQVNLKIMNELFRRIHESLGEIIRVQKVSLNNDSNSIELMVSSTTDTQYHRICSTNTILFKLFKQREGLYIVNN